MCLSIAIHRPGDVLARGRHAGHQWVMTHNGRQKRCGYVRVPRGHPWHGQEIGEVPAEVHGGITFAEPDVACGKGGDDDAYWVGFDCAHGFDASDPSLPVDPDYLAATTAIEARVAARMRAMYGPDWRSMSEGPSAPRVRTQAYVEAECRSLCEQAAAAAGAGRPAAAPAGAGG